MDDLGGLSQQLRIAQTLSGELTWQLGENHSTRPRADHQTFDVCIGRTLVGLHGKHAKHHVSE